MKSKILLAVFAASMAVVATAQTAKPKFDATKIDAAAAPNSRISSIYKYLMQTGHPSTFIAPEGLFGCADEADCEAKGTVYYQRIGALDASNNPTPSRGTMQAWLATHGFSLNPLLPRSDEIRAVYYNRADLGFGRDLHCRTYRKGIEFAVPKDIMNIKSLVAQAGPVQPAKAKILPRMIQPTSTVSACYVTNFGDSANPNAPNGNEQQAITKAKTNSQPIATVAMEVTRSDSSTAAIPEVRFFVYDTGGAFTSGYTPVPTALRGKLLPFAVLDNDHSSDPAGKKANPGTCMNCHGGRADYSTASPSHPIAKTVVTGANFLPFDAQLFGYDATPGSLYSEVAQRETMRKLNAFVKGTQPVAPSITDVITGWYDWCGGVATVGCAIDDSGHAFTPAGWSTPTAAQLASLNTGTPSSGDRTGSSLPECIA